MCRSELFVRVLVFDNVSRNALEIELSLQKITQSDLARYKRQHELIVQICQAYEATPIDYEKLTDLMATV